MPPKVTSLNFTANNIPDQTGKTVVITGATMGLGFASAVLLASKGARIIVHGRTMETARLAVQKIKEQSESELVVPVAGDLASLDSVRQLAQAIAKATKRIDILMLNAGICGIDYTLTEDKIEMHMQVNYVAHYFLVRRLEMMLRQSKTRVVCVSASFAESSSGVPATVKEWNDKKAYVSMRAYSHSKAAMVLLSRGIAEKYGKYGVTSVAVDPGAADTGLQTKATGVGIFAYFVRNMMWLFTSPPELACLTQVRAATDDELENGSGLKLVVFPWPFKGALAKEGAPDALWTMTEKMLLNRGMAIRS